jgi:dihydropteroate synthase
MAVLNVTPDSFSDGGRFGGDPVAAAEEGVRLMEAGADLVDVGGESTRPGAEPVDAEEEARRAVPVVAELARRGVPVSVDTSKPEVAEAALGAGAVVLNDVRGFRDPLMRAVAARHGCTVCAMHMQGEPRTMQDDPRYDDPVREVREWLLQRCAELEADGVRRGQVWIDPGIGFGKRDPHNWALLGALRSLVEPGYPVLVGVSRKGLLGRLLGIEGPMDREAATRGAECWAVGQGARIVRTHDPQACSQALRAFERAQQAAQA